MAMDTVEGMEQDFRNKVCAEIKLEAEGVGRYVINHPFRFDDGDHFVVVLRNLGGAWEFTDEGHAIMHLSYDDLDLAKGGYREIIENTVNARGLQDRQGELVLAVPDARFGDALFSYVQALVKVSDVKYLERERVRSLFMEEFRGFLSDVVPKDCRKFDYVDPQRDPNGLYPIDCRIETGRVPLFVFGVNGDSKCQAATNILYWWEKQAAVFDSAAIFEEQTELNRQVLARFSDVCGKQFSNLYSNRERIQSFIAHSLNGNGHKPIA